MIGAGDLGPMLLALSFLLAAVVSILVAHSIWIWTLVHSPAVAAYSKLARTMLVLLAALTPVLSYYVAGGVRRIASARREGLPSLVPVILITALVAFSAEATIFEQGFDDRAGSMRSPFRIWVNRCIGAGLWFLMIYMPVRVILSAPMPRSVMITGVIAALSVALIVA